MTPLTFPPSFFTSSASPTSSSSFSQTGPTSWNSAPRPRLKRSHSSSLPSAPANSPEGPLSPSLQSAQLLVGQSIGTTSTGEGAGGGGSSGLGQAIRARPSLTVIDEVPQAETLATSPIVPNPLVSSSYSSSQPQPLRDDEEDRPSKSKRRRTAPDHEAFGRLTLSHSPIPSNSGGPSFPPPTSSSSPPSSSYSTSHYSLTSPVQSSFPPVPPTSPDFLPFSHHHHPQQNLSTSPPPLVFPPSSFNPRASGIVAPHSHTNGMNAEEIEMGKAPSSWDVSPHTIYVASLSDDDEDDQRQEEEEEEGEREMFRLNSLATSHLSHSQPILPPRKQKPLDALILYQPPPSIRPPEREERKMETRVERLRREEMERRREVQFGEFRRESERTEGEMNDDLVGVGEGEGEGDGMELELEL